MKYLFFDTETTGLPTDYKAPLTDSKAWPHMVQLAYIVCDENGKELNKSMIVFKVPEDVEMTKGAEETHGITRETSRLGYFYEQEMLRLMHLVKDVDMVVGHKISFDRKIVGAQIEREDMTDFLHGKPRICTMMKSTKYAQIPRKTGKGIKWPTLTELYEKLFGEQFHGSHDALSDIQATKKCFFKLRELGVITDEMIDDELTKWTKKNNELVIEFASVLGVREYGTDILTPQEIEYCKKNNLIVIHGASDDLIAFDGALCDELYHSELTGDAEFSITPDLKIDETGSDIKIRSFQDDYVWNLETVIPHMTFEIQDDGEKFSKGLVIHKNSLLK